MSAAGYLPFFAAAALAAAALLAAAGWVWYTRRALRRIMERMNAMLDTALHGDFTEAAYDESMLSALETKLAQYLSASAVSAKNLAAEKDNIKTLISDISHQTKTPVANLVLYAQLLAEQPLSPEGRACADALNSQAEKLRFLIDALVKTSRLETGILALHPIQAPVGPMLESAVGQMRPAAEKKQLALRLEPALAEAVFDPKWTAEAVCNLLDNAIKYTPAGGCVTVHIVCYELFCRIDVQDTGIGIPESEQAKIFGRFYRAPAARESAGTGLGLYLARQIAAGQGGYLKVASAVGKGSTFSLFLPQPRAKAKAGGLT
ncbi:MAG: HAMP domain-containing histidine kinase [Faecalibacterium sp.]|nr:HAMP domain-containing histidine kinase [Faecalibacterium sp.]